MASEPPWAAVPFLPEEVPLAVRPSRPRPRPVLATTTSGAPDMPWTGPLQGLLDNLSGPTARIIGALAFVVGGAMWAFTRHEEGAKRFGQAIVGIAVMIGAANIVSALAFSGADGLGRCRRRSLTRPWTRRLISRRRSRRT